MQAIIEVNNLSKKYRYGESQPYFTLRDAITGIVKSPFYLINKNQRVNSLKRNEFWALKNISFKINKGEAIGIIGANGSGKSTLLKILSRITPPTSGEAVLRGKVGSLLEVGTGFQQELTGRENIYLNGAILGMTKREISKKFNEIVDFSGVEKFLDTPVKHYSSGMYVRLAFAVAAHLEPDILLVDEVLAVGDVEFQKKCLGKMNDITKGQGRTVLFVSHNMGAVKGLCPKTIYISGGEVLAFGNTDEVIGKYLSNSLVQPGGSVKNVKHRKGNGKVRVEEISVTNEKGESTISTFDKLRMVIKLNSVRKVKNIELKIPFMDSASEVLFRVDTGNLKTKELKSPSIAIETGRLNFTPTKCFINIGVFADGELSDYLENIYSFEIHRKYKNDIKLYEREACLLMIPHRIIK